MLGVKETIVMRRSIRHFRPDDVPDELIEQGAFPKSIGQRYKSDYQ